MIRYYEFISFIKIPASLLLALDTSYFNQAQLLFFNFTSTNIYPLFMARSAPSKTVTKAIPNGNLFGPVNQIRFWGSTIIATGGLVAGYLYFMTTE
jgi:magnesium-transporting ATPase (P-type)